MRAILTPVLLLLLGTTLAQAANRVALIIGNSKYANLAEGQQLTSPVNDAKDLAAALQGLGYTLINGGAITDTNKDTIIAATEEFATKAKDADAAVFYFSGHGIQVGEDNFLMPSDTPRISSYTVLKNRSVHLREAVMVALEEARAKTKVIILDCCRENPFASQVDQALGRIGKSMRTKGGLGEITGYGPGFFLAFATSPGTLADDGNGARNSPFTAALLTHLKTSSGEDITPLFRKVKATVRERSGADQVPWTNDSLLESFAFTKQFAPSADMPSGTQTAPPMVLPPNAPVAVKGDSDTSTEPSTSGWEMLEHENEVYVSADSIYKFYRFESVEYTKNGVTFTSPVLMMKSTVGSRDLSINNIKLVQNHPVLLIDRKVYFSRLDLCKIIDPVLRPSYINKASDFDTVVIDPAYRGLKNESKELSGREKDYTLKLALALRSDLEKRGLKVVLTRQIDSYIPVDIKTALANKTDKSIFLNLQFKSGPYDTRGIETFALAPEGAPGSNFKGGSDELGPQPGNEHDAENMALATALHASVINNMGLTDRGVQHARVDELKQLVQPGVSLVVGYLANPADAKMIATDEFHNELANALGHAIENYRRALAGIQEPEARSEDVPDADQLVPANTKANSQIPPNSATASRRTLTYHGHVVTADTIDTGTSGLRARGNVEIQTAPPESATGTAAEVTIDVGGDEIVMRGMPILNRGKSQIEGLNDGTAYYIRGSRLQVVGKHRVGTRQN